MQQAAAPIPATATTTTLGAAAPRRVMVLRAKVQPPEARRVVWDPNTKDPPKNQRTSKKCCVFHRHRLFGESDSDSDSDGGCDDHDHPNKPKCSRDGCYCNTKFA